MGKWELDRNKIKGIMKENKLTQAEVATSLGITQASVWNKLNGITGTDDKELCKLAELLNTNPSIFFTQKLSNNANEVMR